MGGSSYGGRRIFSGRLEGEFKSVGNGEVIGRVVALLGRDGAKLLGDNFNAKEQRARRWLCW